MSMIIRKKLLGFPWETQNPFLFCVYHADAYPKGNNNLGPDPALLKGRNIGQDFTLKDGWRMYHGETVPGFPMHPHRGFETVTVVEEGLVDHADSLGGAGRYGEGDVQWMTAGAGIQHSEMFPLLSEEHDNPLELFQIWLNLPKANKFANPYYTMLWHEKIPVVTIDGEEGKTRVKLVAGALNGEKAPDPAPDSWAADQQNELAIWVIQMDPGSSFTIPAVSNQANRSIYFFEGASMSVGEETIENEHLYELKPDLEIPLKNGSKKSRLLFLQGIPIKERVVHYGPFVMNSEGEIQQAMLDYQKTRFGGWPWPRQDMVHGNTKGRFASYVNGTEEKP